MRRRGPVTLRSALSPAFPFHANQNDASIISKSTRKNLWSQGRGIPAPLRVVVGLGSPRVDMPEECDLANHPSAAAAAPRTGDFDMALGTPLPPVAQNGTSGNVETLPMILIQSSAPRLQSPFAAGIDPWRLPRRHPAGRSPARSLPQPVPLPPPHVMEAPRHTEGVNGAALLPMRPSDYGDPWQSQQQYLPQQLQRIFPGDHSSRQMQRQQQQQQQQHPTPKPQQQSPPHPLPPPAFTSGWIPEHHPFQAMHLSVTAPSNRASPQRRPFAINDSAQPPSKGSISSGAHSMPHPTPHPMPHPTPHLAPLPRRTPNPRARLCCCMCCLCCVVSGFGPVVSGLAALVTGGDK